MKRNGIYILPVMSKEQIEGILGEPQWAWDTIHADKSECGLEDGEILTAGYGSCAACCRLWIHNNGVCLRHALNVEDDKEYAKQIYQKLKKQPVRS